MDVVVTCKKILTDRRTSGTHKSKSSRGLQEYLQLHCAQPSIMPITRRNKRGATGSTMTTTTKDLPSTPPRRSRRKDPQAASTPATMDSSDDEEEPETPSRQPAQEYVFDGVAYPSYQEMVNAKRQRNQQILEGLGFAENTPTLASTKTKQKTATQRGLKRQKISPELQLPRRKSSRLSSDKTTTRLVALDYYVNDWNRNHSTIVQVEGNNDDDDDNDDTVEEEPTFFKDRLNDGSDLTLQQAMEQMQDKWLKEDTIANTEAFFQTEIQPLAKRTTPSKQGKSPTSVVDTWSDEELAKKVEELSIDKEEWVAKVTPERIYSVAAHPATDKLIACAGDKLGYVGLWDVDAPASATQNGVHLFRLHSRPVCSLDWATPNTLLSSSYDGTVRRLDVERGVFEEIFASYDDSDAFYAEELGYGMDEGYRFWHQHVSLDHRYTGPNPCLFVATSVGTAMHLDLRVATKQRVTFKAQLSEKKINTLSLHPNGTSLASAGNDGTINIWDVRKLGKGRKGVVLDSIASQTVGLSISSAFFSPSGSSLLATSFANKLDLIDDAHTLKGTMKPTKRIQHNNQTGRWLSTFMAAWHPERDVFVCGSMKKPRCMEVFDEQGNLLRGVSGDALTAVASRCCFHPSPDKLVMIGGNSSGRVVAVR